MSAIPAPDEQAAGYARTTGSNAEDGEHHGQQGLLRHLNFC
jgi:hypothetical protein